MHVTRARPASSNLLLLLLLTMMMMIHGDASTASMFQINLAMAISAVVGLSRLETRLICLHLCLFSHNKASSAAVPDAPS